MTIFSSVMTFSRAMNFFLQSYDLSVEVSDLLDGDTFTVVEKQKESKYRYSLHAGRLNVTCIFDGLTSKGYLVEG